jgi:hypothetical protein
VIVLSWTAKAGIRKLKNTHHPMMIHIRRDVFAQ